MLKMFLPLLLLSALSYIVASLGIESTVAVEPYWADQSLIVVGDLWYSFPSSPGDGVNIPAIISSGSYFWTRITNSDILPNLPAWAVDDGNIWAPEVFRRVPFGLWEP
jgi:hypothetical protein